LPPVRDRGDQPEAPREQPKTPDVTPKPADKAKPAAPTHDASADAPEPDAVAPAKPTNSPGTQPEAEKPIRDQIEDLRKRLEDGVALERLDPEAVLGGPAPAPGMVKAVLGPGTGLGVAGLVPARGGWVPVPGEGGHVSVPAVTDLEIEVVRALRADGMAFVDAEHLLSGPGLVRLRHGLALVAGITVTPLTAAEIVARVDDSLCSRTVSVFCGLLGSFAANVALTLGAHGGVYLGGGIVPRIVRRIRDSDFRRRFEANLVLSGYLTQIATTAIVAEQPALTGAAAWLGQRFADQAPAPARVPREGGPPASAGANGPASHRSRSTAS
jgi:glucokinase